jgi:hypothetical protein
VPHGEANRDTERARALDGWSFRTGPERQRGNRHQVIGAKPVQKSKKERGRNEDQGVTSQAA